MNAVYSIEEYGCLVADRQVAGCVSLPAASFERLENFILSNRAGSEPLELMGVSARRGAGRVLTARNYVGVIALADGTVVEILPKICSAAAVDDPRARARQLLIDMLGALPDAPYRSLHSTGIDAARMNLLEVFIRMFIDEALAIVKRGLRRAYAPVEEDAPFLRGKLDLSRHIRANAAHRERFAIVSDRYTADRPENRLLKAALARLLRQSRSAKNRRDLRLLLNAFEEVPPCADVAADLARCVSDRSTRDYARALTWCRVFLLGQGFTPFAGRDAALALLFPMEMLFERYVGRLLRRRLAGDGFDVVLQDRSLHLFDEPQRFRLRPDILVRRGGGDAYILDTKWKLLRADAPNFGISPADMYQLCAYQRRYGARSATLIYPWTQRAPRGTERVYTAADGTTVRIQFFDLFRPRESLEALVAPMRAPAPQANGEAASRPVDERHTM